MATVERPDLLWVLKSECSESQLRKTSVSCSVVNPYTTFHARCR